MASLALSRELLDVGASPRLPATIRFAGKAAGKAWIEFFTAQIRNANTRSAYHHACTQFFALIETTGLALVDIEAAHVAAYIEGLCHSHSAPTAKQHLAALRSLFDFMVVRQALPQNPAAAVRGPKHQVSEGKTPILSAEETRALFEQFDETRLIDVRDRAVVAVMVYSFARVGALTKMRVRDYYRQGAKAWFILDEKGGKQRRVPAHHQAAAYVEAYLERGGFNELRDAPLFQSFTARGTRLTGRSLARGDAWAMIQRRAARAGLPLEIGCHSFRGTGITNYLENGGQLETAREIAGHVSTKTTQLYDRRGQKLQQTEIERIRF